MAKQNLITLFVLLFSFFNLNIAQITISGTISDPNFNSVSNALVEIFDQNDTLNKYTATTDISGNFIISNITDIKNYESNLPNDYLFLRNYPNPFNPSTIIYFEIPTAENIEIKIFDILGREIRTLFSGFHKAGADQINWDGRNNYSHGVSAGIYLCQLRTKDRFKVHKLVLLDGGTNSSVNISYNKISNQGFQKTTKVNARFNFNVKVTGDSLDATYFRNLTCTKDTTLNLIVSKIIKTETIGIAGGVVGNDDFKISIPSGAFDGDYNISLIKIEDDGTFGENTVTPSFKLSGIPNNYSKPLKIIAKYSGELTGESYMGISKKVYDIINADSSIVYDLHSAIDSLGYIVSSIPQKQLLYLPKSNVDETDDFEKLIKFLTSYTYSQTEHFVIRYPVIYAEKIPLLAQVFEDAYTVVFDGFQMTSFDYFPDVILESISTPIYDDASVNPVIGMIYSQTFYVSKDFVYDLQFNDIQVGAVQGLFLPSDIIYSSKNWVDYAFYFWIEDLISDDPNFKFPKNFLLYGSEPFNGFNAKYTPSKDTPEKKFMNDHGLGMTAVIKYLREFRSMEYSAIGNYYRTMSYQTRLTEFLNLVPDPITEWWPDFFKKYVNNELFELPDDYFINRAHAEWNINSEEDVTKTFASADVGTYQDLSAKIFKINFNFTDLDETQNLKFKMIGTDNNKDLSLILFGIKNNKLEFIEKTQSAEYELDNTKSYFASGTTGFLAVLVNSNITQGDYLGESEIDLEMRITPKIELPTCTFDITQYNQCSVGLVVNATVRTDYENGDTKNEDRYFIQGSGIIDGSFNGNQFIGFIETDFGYDTLKVSLSQDLKFVESVSWTKYEENTVWGFYFLKGIDASEIPINCDFPNKFEIIGNDACGYIDEIYYSYWTDLWIETISDWTCSETSHITITFSKK